MPTQTCLRSCSLDPTFCQLLPLSTLWRIPLWIPTLRARSSAAVTVSPFSARFWQTQCHLSALLLVGVSLHPGLWTTAPSTASSQSLTPPSPVSLDTPPLGCSLSMALTGISAQPLGARGAPRALASAYAHPLHPHCRCHLCAAASDPQTSCPGLCILVAVLTQQLAILLKLKCGCFLSPLPRVGTTVHVFGLVDTSQTHFHLPLPLWSGGYSHSAHDYGPLLPRSTPA